MDPAAYYAAAAMASSSSSSPIASLDGFTAFYHPGYPVNAHHSHDMSPNASADSKQRMRISMACVHCRARKIRCDGIQPSCATCIRLKRSCAYEHVTEFENMLTRERKARGKEAKLARMAMAGSQSPSRDTPKPATSSSSSSMERSASRPYPPRRAVTSYDSTSPSSRVPRRRGATVGGHEAQPQRSSSPLELLRKPVSAFQSPSMSCSSSNGFSLPATPAWVSFPSDAMPTSSSSSSSSFPSSMTCPTAALPLSFDETTPQAAANVAQWLDQQMDDAYASPDANSFAPSWPLSAAGPSLSSSGASDNSAPSPTTAAPSPISATFLPIVSATHGGASSSLGLDLTGDVYPSTAPLSFTQSFDAKDLTTQFLSSFDGLALPQLAASSNDASTFVPVVGAYPQNEDLFLNTLAARRPSESLFGF